MSHPRRPRRVALHSFHNGTYRSTGAVSNHAQDWSACHGFLTTKFLVPAAQYLRVSTERHGINGIKHATGDLCIVTE